MKIPELTPNVNVGAYYGNEENGQWQPNGVIIDSGVGGGVVGSGDAGVHRPPVYPVHIPRGHIPGYVMAGAYYPPAYPQAPPAPQDDFADYMWMENEEEFDKQVMQQLEEEALMEQCIEAMLEDEQRERRAPTANGHKHYPTTSNGPGLSLEETVSRSTLNPLAAEFVPTRRVPHAAHVAPTSHVAPAAQAEDKQKPQDAVADTTQPASVDQKEAENRNEEVKSAESKAEDVPPPPTDPPEVSAADVLPIEKPLDKRQKDVRKDPKQKPDVKKTVKPADVKKAKVVAVVAKSETRVQAPPKKKEVKQVKSETKVEKAEEKSPAPVEESPAVVEIAKQPSPPPEDVPSGPKPINYAAAAKANKPKKSTTPPITEKTPPPKPDKPATVKPEKPKPKEKLKEKPMPRKNSAK